MKKLLALALSVIMILSLATTAFAQDVDSGKGGNASITIKNAAMGETYKVMKLFDATVTGKEDGSIAYSGTIPAELASYFTQDTVGNIFLKEGTDEEALIADITAWANEQEEVTASAVSDGSVLTFTGLEYGYYAVVTTQGAVVTIDSTNPNATVYDKNTTTPGIVKSVDDPDVDIGQTVTYTATATTATYLGKAPNSEIVTQYVIDDTLPAFLSNVKIVSITIDGKEYTVNGEVPQFDTVEGHTNKAVVIPWATKESGKWVSLYKNGAEIVVTYSATVTREAVIDGETGNINVVTLTPYTTPDDTTPPAPWQEHWQDDEVIYTYAAALQKVDENKKPLAGAKFAANGLTVEKISAGAYKVVSYDPTSTTPGTEMECDTEGQLVILGLSSESELTLTETEAPAGYNKLTETVTMTPVKTGKEIKASQTTVYYDENGNVTDIQTETSYEKTTYNVELLKTAIVVVNNKGTILPETGGMGTTLFYVVGGLLVAAAAILLITKKRMASAE